MPAPADRLNKLPTYPFAVLNQRIRELSQDGFDVIRLDVGSPDLPPPPSVVDCLTESVRQPDRHGYSGYKGTPAFREAVAAYYAARFGVALDPEHEVLPLIGSKEGIVNLAFAYLGHGDLALVPDISYPAYSIGARLAGGDYAWVPSGEAENYLPDLSMVSAETAARAKLLWVNYPNNPTGATAEVDFYTRAVAFCKQHDILLASDNPYVDVTFDGYRAPSALQVEGARDCTVEFISFSKTYNMAGWRLGAAVGNAEALKLLHKVKSNVDSGHFHAIYDAGVAATAIPSSWIDERNRVYQQRRDRIMAALPDIGLSAQTPKGSLYVWARVIGGDGGSYARRALDGAHVSLAPGEFYGPGGTDYIRFSLGMGDARLDEALERLRRWHNGRRS